MIRVHITTTSETAAREIAASLLRERLATDIRLSDNKQMLVAEGFSWVEEREYTVSANTKALLYGDIEELMEQNFSNSYRLLWAIPIVHMPQKLAAQLRSKTRPV
jgi:uncharacterized protein involved in tolerance to divalent cations